jgi:hypothetical protein
VAGITREQLRAAQREDDYLSEMVQICENTIAVHGLDEYRGDDGRPRRTAPASMKRQGKKKKEAQSFELEKDGLLMRRQYQTTMIAVPVAMQERLVMHYHTDKMHGHQGWVRTLARLRQQFWFKGASTLVKRLAKECDCRWNKQPRRKVGEHDSSVPLEVLQGWGIDHVGPLPKAGGNQFLLTMIELSTGWTQSVAVPDMTAETTAKYVFRDIVCRFGCPKHIRSDKGGAFISEMFQALVKLMGGVSITTTGYRAQANGAVERSHRTLFSVIRQMLKGYENKTTWAEAAEVAHWVINSSVTGKTPYTPHELLFGTKPGMPGDMREAAGHLEKVADPGREKWLKARIEAMEEMRDSFGVAMQVKKDEDVDRYNEGRVLVEYQVGDLVYRYRRALVRQQHKLVQVTKLLPKWVGPLKVVKKVTPSDRPGGKTKRKMTNVYVLAEVLTGRTSKPKESVVNAEDMFLYIKAEDVKPSDLLTAHAAAAGGVTADLPDCYDFEDLEMVILRHSINPTRWDLAEVVDGGQAVGPGEFLAHYWHTASGYHGDYSAYYPGYTKADKVDCTYKTVDGKRILQQDYYATGKRFHSDVPIVVYAPRVNVIVRNVRLTEKGRCITAGDRRTIKNIMSTDPAEYQVWHDRPTGATTPVCQKEGVEWQLIVPNEGKGLGQEARRRGGGQVGARAPSDKTPEKAVSFLLPVTDRAGYTAGVEETQPEVTTPVAPKRGRGRPRKVRPCTEEKEGEPVVAPKRGRGRPRKVQDTTAPGEAWPMKATVAQQKQVSAGRRRSPRLAAL